MGVNQAPAHETLLAFDFGEKRIGVAVGNTITGQARALTTLNAVTVVMRFAGVAALLAEWQPQRLVVGIPYASDGSAHTMTARCKRFAQQLHGRYNLPVELVDERYTSTSAESVRRDEMRAGGAARASGKNLAIDPRAAEIILQSYLDHQHDRHLTDQLA